MSTEIKSGKEILDEFFEEVKGDEKLEKNTAGAIIDLYNYGKLTDRNLTNALSDLRDKKDNDKTE
jgi:hypothetical protein